MQFRTVRSRRRSVVIDVDRELNVVVKAPYGVTDRRLNDFVNANLDRIEKNLLRQKHINEIKAVYSTATPQGRRKRLEAAALLAGRTDYWSSVTGLVPHSVRLSSSEKRLGSCSSSGNISLSVVLLMYEEELRDAVIVHELVHLRHMNHGKGFYRELLNIMPDYRERFNRLKQ